MSFFRRFIQSQITLSRRFDRVFLPAEYGIDGSSEYRKSLLPKYLASSGTVYDVGGGKSPAISAEMKTERSLTLIGLDIDAHELARAPAGMYDESIAADILTYHGKADADVVLCHTLLEHVKDVEAAFQNIAGILKPGGLALVFAPSRHALFARLNLLLPERVKQWMLFTIFPETRHHQGFRSYYHRCTPRDFEQIAEECGLTLLEKRVYFLSGYFSCLFPAYLLWRMWVLLFRLSAGEQAAESFSMVFQKKS